MARNFFQRHFRCNRRQNQLVAALLNEYFIRRKPIFSRNPHCLRTAVFKHLGDLHLTSPSLELVSIIDVYHRLCKPRPVCVRNKTFMKRRREAKPADTFRLFADRTRTFTLKSPNRRVRKLPLEVSSDQAKVRENRKENERDKGEVRKNQPFRICSMANNSRPLSGNA